MTRPAGHRHARARLLCRGRGLDLRQQQDLPARPPEADLDNEALARARVAVELEQGSGVPVGLGHLLQRGAVQLGHPRGPAAEERGLAAARGLQGDVLDVAGVGHVAPTPAEEEVPRVLLASPIRARELLLEFLALQPPQAPQHLEDARDARGAERVAPPLLADLRLRAPALADGEADGHGAVLQRRHPRETVRLAVLRGIEVKVDLLEAAQGKDAPSPAVAV
mmetsp:Transcript_65016/g.181797  ORF Transcript_65016/g.181797 Transcript_65016/m.181797 type:complete len:223 (+) Transcript_65016:63-731(+)